MNVRMFLVVAVVAASLLFIIGSFKQAQANTLLVVLGTQNIENYAKADVLQNQNIIGEQEQDKQQAKLQERDKGGKPDEMDGVAAIEPAAG